MSPMSMGRTEKIFLQGTNSIMITGDIAGNIMIEAYIFISWNILIIDKVRIKLPSLSQVAS